MVPSSHIDHQLINERLREFRAEGEHARAAWQARRTQRRIRFHLPHRARRSADRSRPTMRPHGV